MLAMFTTSSRQDYLSEKFNSIWGGKPPHEITIHG